MKEILKYLFFIIIAAGIIYGGWKLSEWFINKQVQQRANLLVPDTLVVERLKTVIKSDTVIRWYEVPFYKESKPEIVYIQSDSSFRDNLDDKDLIVSLKKEDDKLQVVTHNYKDSLIKEYHFNDVGNDFSASATAHNIFVKSQKFYWEGITLSAELGLNMNSLKKMKEMNSYNKNLSISTEFSYIEMLGLELGIKYDINTKDYFLFTKLNYKIY